MSAQSDPRYDTQTEGENRIYRLRIVNPWKLMVLGLSGGKLGLSFYARSEDLHIAEDLAEVLEEMGRLELPGRRLALKSEPYLKGLNKKYEEKIRTARKSLLHLAQEFD